MIRHVCVLLILLGGMIFFVKDYIPSDPYIYDEADYMFVVSQGWLANYLDSPSQSIADFIRTGLGRGKDAAQRQALSEQVRASGDVDFYRHWHGPLYFFWLSGWSAWNANEYSMRAASFVIPGVTVFLVYFGVLWLIPGYPGRWAAILCATFYLWSYSTLRSMELAPHQLHAACYIATLILVSKAMQTGDRRLWYAAAVGCGLAFCTLEIALTLICVTGILACVALFRTERRVLLHCVLLFVGTVFVLWPTAILKLTFLKSYAFMAYLALFRKSPWGQITFAQTWSERFRNAPFEWLLVVAGLALFIRYRQRVLLPFVLYAVLTLVAVLRVNSDSPRYLLPFLPAFLLIAGMSIGIFLGRFRAGIAALCVVVLCLLTAWSTHRQFATHPAFQDPRERAVLAFIRDHGLGDKELSVPQSDLPTIHYYFPRTKLHGYADASQIGAAKSVDAILYENSPLRFELSRHRQ